MYNLTNKQIDFILDDIKNKGILTEDIRLNILDHVCCIIENEMEAGMNFIEVYQNTITKFYKKELSEIEIETQILLTYKNYYTMKKTIKTSGVTSIILIMIGVIFKSMHWPGAGAIVIFGLAFFSLIFIPLNVILMYKDDEQKRNRLTMTLGLLTASAGIIGGLLKILEWPHANIIMFISLIIFMLIFIPIYFIVNYRQPESKFNAIINTTFMVGAAGMIFALINLHSI